MKIISEDTEDKGNLSNKYDYNHFRRRERRWTQKILKLLNNFDATVETLFQLTHTMDRGRVWLIPPTYGWCALDWKMTFHNRIKAILHLSIISTCRLLGFNLDGHINT